MNYTGKNWEQSFLAGEINVDPFVSDEPDRPPIAGGTGTNLMCSPRVSTQSEAMCYCVVRGWGCSCENSFKQMLSLSRPITLRENIKRGREKLTTFDLIKADKFGLAETWDVTVLEGSNLRERTGACVGTSPMRSPGYASLFKHVRVLILHLTDFAELSHTDG